MALLFAKDKYPDAKLDYMHIEFIVPENLDDCKWAGLGELGNYAPDGNVDTHIPGGKTWNKGPYKSVRAHELGHNMGMHHSSSLDCDGFVEYGDPRCIMGSGDTSFNAPQRLTHGWITRAPQFASAKIFPRSADLKPAHANWRGVRSHRRALVTTRCRRTVPRPFAVWRVRRLDLDHDINSRRLHSGVPCQGRHEADSNPGTWQAELASGQWPILEVIHRS